MTITALTHEPYLLFTPGISSQNITRYFYLNLNTPIVVLSFKSSSGNTESCGWTGYSNVDWKLPYNQSWERFKRRVGYCLDKRLLKASLFGVVDGKKYLLIHS
jgi:hypothetical protein